MTNITQRIEQLKDPVIRSGDTGEPIRQLQEALVNAGYGIDIDGVYGKDTVSAVISFQKTHGLVVDGVCGPKTIATLLDSSNKTKFLSEDDLKKAAAILDCEVGSIKAAHLVESAGKGFFDDGRPKILYERHIMRRRLLEYKIDPTPYITKFPNLVNVERGGYFGGVKEYGRLTQAETIHKRAAMESCSWGAYQIMGYYYKLFGYANVEEMVADVYISEAKQLELFVKFIKADPRLLKAIQNKDWVTFAAAYNGTANVDVYSSKLANAYQLSV